MANSSYVVSTWVDRSINEVGISFHDFEQMTELAKTNATIRDLLEQLKVVYKLSDPNYRLDEHCKSVKD